MKGAFAVLLMLGLTACATTSSAGNQAEKDLAEKAYFYCTIHAAKQLDDGSPDITGIELAVKSACAPQFSSVTAQAQTASSR